MTRPYMKGGTVPMLKKSFILFCLTALVLTSCTQSPPAETTNALPAETQTEATLPLPESDLIPTQANLEGLHHDKLFIPINGATYRYEYLSGMVEDVTPGEMLYTFTESFTIQHTQRYTRTLKIHEIAESPDRRILYVITEDEHYGDKRELYQYAPPRACDPDALEKAKAEDYVVLEDGDMTAGHALWETFYSTVTAGKAAKIKLARYDTLDPDRLGESLYEATKEDYPSLSYIEISYDGWLYTIKSDDTLIGNYPFLMRFEDHRPATSSREERFYIRYVLTHDDDLTWAEIEYGLFSSQLGDYIEHYSIYTEKRK